MIKIARQLKATVFYTSGQLTYNFPFDYLHKSFVKVKYVQDINSADDYDNAIDLEYGQEYTIEDKTVKLKVAKTSTHICIYRETPTDTIVDFSDSSILIAKDLDIFDTQKLHLNEELSDWVVLHGKFIGDSGSSGGNSNCICDKLKFDTIENLKDSTYLEVGQKVTINGYYEKDDGGAANYIITSPTQEEIANKPWLIPLANGLFAEINEKEKVNYKQFGAYLDGIQDDGTAMLLCHKYADSIYNLDSDGLLKNYLCKVENHQGTIYKKNTEAINFCSDIDLSGSTLLIDDTNATWYGIYVWGDVNSLYWDLEIDGELKDSLRADTFKLNVAAGSDTLKQNAIIKLEETPYTARDDSGYLYTVARRELIVHDANGICSSPLTDDWQYAGGEEINCQISDLENGGYKTEQSFTTFTTSFTYGTNRHGTFIGCDVKLNMSANKYCSVAWVKRHNATIKNFVFRPNLKELHNTAFKNAMIYIWDSYNITVQNLQGFNASGQKDSANSNGTSGYLLRMTNVSDVHVEDCRMQGYWGATAMDSVKNIYFKRCHMNRFDIHDYFYNLWLDECTFYNHAIQIGYGRGVCSITNSNFFYNPIELDSYPSAHMVEFNLTYGRIFEGKLYMDNCRVYVQEPPDDEFNIFKMEFSPDATSITKHFRFPEITVNNCYIHSSKDDTHYAYFKVTGSRRCATSSIRPSHVYGVCADNNVIWKYLGRGVNWGEDITEIEENSILRVMDSFLDKDGKTQFYNRRYYICTKAGTLNFSGTKPIDTSGAEFTCGSATLKYITNPIWRSNKSYSVNDICATSPSNFFPLYIFKCIQAGTSNGYFPTHTSGTVLEGINDSVNEPDDCWWTYISAKASWCTDWLANMSVIEGQRIIAEGRIYEVIKAGTLIETPPYDTYWFGESLCGTATLKFIGQSWSVQAWYKKDSYCEANGNIYQLTKHDGITSGVYPVRGNPYCVDGDIIWEYVSGDNTGESGGGGEKPDDDIYLNEIITTTKASEWIDNKIFSIPNNMTKIKITAIGQGGTLEIAYIKVGDPWTEGNTGVALDITPTGTSCILNVPVGKTIRPVFNFNDGTENTTTTFKIEGSAEINKLEATDTIEEYKETTTTTVTLSNFPVAVDETDTWKANTSYNEGDIVISNGNTYKCIFDGKLILPNKSIFSNILTNMNNGHIFWFYSGTNIPTKKGNRDWTILAKNCEGIDNNAEGISGSTPYFCHEGNPNPIVNLE